MDFTPNEHRGKLNVIQSIIQGCQNLFTMLGGVLAESLGIYGLFTVVALLNFVTLIPLVFIHCNTQEFYQDKIKLSN